MHRRAERRSWTSCVGSALLTVAALLGTVCIVLVPLAFVFHISLIMFKTNSMSPTMPAGSLALVRDIPASDVHVGDVVTVDRSPAPPITHRVTSVDPGPGSARTITLRGDANPADDPAPYVVTRVRRVMIAVPRLAYAVRAVSDPVVMAGITLAAAALVTWAFWPRDRARRGRPRHAAAQGHHVPVPHTVLALVLLSAAAMGPPHTTLASWTDAEYTNAPLAAGTVSPPTALHCSAGVLTPPTFSWTAPVGGLSRTKYHYTLVGTFNDSQDLTANATSVTIAAGLLTVGSATFTLWAVGPAGWTSAVVTGTASQLTALLYGCSVP